MKIVMASMRELAVGGVYDGMTDAQCQRHAVRYLVVRAATEADWRKAVVDHGGLTHHCRPEPGTRFYEVLMD